MILDTTMRRRHGCTAAEVFHALAFVNRGRCRPPLAEAEVWAVARNIARYGQVV
jgi:hypothetical protein